MFEKIWKLTKQSPRIAHFKHILKRRRKNMARFRYFIWSIRWVPPWQMGIRRSTFVTDSKLLVWIPWEGVIYFKQKWNNLGTDGGVWIPLLAVWPDLAKFRILAIALKVLCDYVTAYLVLGKILNLLCSTFYAIGQIFIVANGLILINNLATGHTVCFWKAKIKYKKLPNTQTNVPFLKHSARLSRRELLCTLGEFKQR